MEILLQLPGTDPYTASYVQTVVLKGEYDPLYDVYNFSATQQAIEDLVRQAKAAGVNIHIRRDS